MRTSIIYNFKTEKIEVCVEDDNYGKVMKGNNSKMKKKWKKKIVFVLWWMAVEVEHNTENGKDKNCNYSNTILAFPT